MERSTEHDLVNALIFDASPVPCYVWGHNELGTMLQATRYSPDCIFIPQESRGQTIAGFPMSARLAHLLEDKGIRLFGQLHGLNFSALTARRNCGLKTVREIRELVQMVQRGRAPIYTAPAQNIYISSAKRLSNRRVVVPFVGRELNPFDLPISARLANVLRKKRVTRLIDLHDISYEELLSVKGCGIKVVEELERLLERLSAGDFHAPDKAFIVTDASELLRSLDQIVAKLPARDHDIFLLRLGATNNRPLTLEDIGSKFNLTRERVRQIVEKALSKIQKEGGPNLNAQLSGVAGTCHEMVCPLTPEMFYQWLGQSPNEPRFPIAFYIRLLAELNAKIPGWARGQEPSASQTFRANSILKDLQSCLEDSGPTLPLKTAFQVTCANTKPRRFTVDEFLETIKHAKIVVVQFPQPDQPEVRLRHVRIVPVAKSILKNSDQLLTPEEILTRGQRIFGRELIDWDPRTMGNALVPEKGFYLLGPRAFGLRQHFRLNQAAWQKVRADTRAFLAKENRPISTTEIVNDSKFSWTEQINAYELAQILREDKHFIDLGRFLFALATWGIEERDYVKDLITKVLAEVGRPMTASQILERLQRMRSTSASSIPLILRKHPLVRSFGFGHFGLRSWGEAVKATIVANVSLLDRVIRRSEPPLSFSHLCEILEVPSESSLGDKLWQTCASVRSVICSPDERTPLTLLLHKSCSLERALVATARALGRPLPLYEFQWELNTRFGPLFAQRSNSEIKRCLEQSHLFLRDADDEFILDIHLDQLGLDEKAIRDACLEILLDSNEIVGCDDLIERLEAEGKVWEDLSPDILGSLLREDKAFQEVGRNRFRAKPCKP